ncbi:MAG: ThiF family adenylyltransferase [Planctomycetes bacterium]|nr:ThiF family adenylyltransferase [Planctomycetota bacterium]
MTNRITITTALVDDLRRRLAESPGSVVEVPAGLRKDTQGLEFLAPLGARRPGGRRGPPAVLRFALLPHALEGISHHWWEGFPNPLGARPRADLALYEERGCSGAVLVDGEVRPIDEVVLAGPRMERWRPGTTPADLVGTVPEDGPFSRYIGALGGCGAHERLRALSAAGIGMARLNSLQAVALVRAGVRRLALIDPDVLESHSLDAVEALAAGSVGRPKVGAVADMLRRVAPDVALEELAVPADHILAAAACARADLVFSAPDQNQARLLAALVARAHHRVHLDVGTGVFGAGDEFVAGADIRLIVPGDGCLLCVGGLDLRRPRERDWRRQRAGSLRSLNGVATSLAMFLLERFLIGDLQHSVWMQVTLDRRGELASRRMPRQPDPDCVVCAHAGAGDAVLTSGVATDRSASRSFS